jgi:hypothetical protein
MHPKNEGLTPAFTHSATIAHPIIKSDPRLDAAGRALHDPYCQSCEEPGRLIGQIMASSGPSVYVCFGAASVTVDGADCGVAGGCVGVTDFLERLAFPSARFISSTCGFTAFPRSVVTYDLPTR